MNILLLGSGGRESALAWKISQSPLCHQLYIAPGNAGTEQYGINIPISVMSFEAIKKAAIDFGVGMVVVGPEDPLVGGIYDYFQRDEQLRRIIVVGPSEQGAQLEGSKAFSKKFMERHQIPTAAYREFDESSYEAGVAYLQQHSLPVVLKADGLAAGKGVVIAQSTEEALAAFHTMIREAQFGEASKKVVIEQFLEGVECSVFALTDGSNYVLLPVAKDYKRIGEGDTGLNTGGMGAISPVPFADDAFMSQVVAQIVEPTIKGLAAEQIVYKGFVFFGLIKVNSAPYVIEYNCRMGDPETEVVVPRLENDIVQLFLSMHEGRLNEVTVQYSRQAAATVMLVAAGYPGSYEKGKPMTGFDQVSGSIAFHAGTAKQGDGIVSNGGRIIAITSYGDDIHQALETSYSNAERIQYEGKYYRRDIGFEFE